MIVLVVSDSRQHRQRILRNRRSQIIVIEAGQVQFGSATAHDKHCIILLARIQNSIHGHYDRPWTIRALHQSREKISSQRESIRIFCNMAHEIAVTSSIFCRNHCQFIRKCWQSKLLLQIHDSLLRQTLDSLLLLQFLHTQ